MTGKRRTDSEGARRTGIGRRNLAYLLERLIFHFREDELDIIFFERDLRGASTLVELVQRRGELSQVSCGKKMRTHQKALSETIVSKT